MRNCANLPLDVGVCDGQEAILSVPDSGNELDVRDRASLELLYSTGIRRRELMHLRIHDLDVERRTLMVRQGKGNKDRLVPIGEQAIDWTEKYQAEVRSIFAREPDGGILFLTSTGEQFSPNHLTHLAPKYIKSADIGKTGSCHLFRHTMATLMLEGGADVRFIQEMLGHANLKSTQIYTQVSIRKLQEIYAATHPSAKRSRYKGRDVDEEAGETTGMTGNS